MNIERFDELEVFLTSVARSITTDLSLTTKSSFSLRIVSVTVSVPNISPSISRKHSLKWARSTVRRPELYETVVNLLHNIIPKYTVQIKYKLFLVDARPPVLRRAVKTASANMSFTGFDSHWNIKINSWNNWHIIFLPIILHGTCSVNIQSGVTTYVRVAQVLAHKEITWKIYFKYCNVVLQQDIDGFKHSNSAFVSWLHRLNVAGELIQMVFELRQTSSELDTLSLGQDARAEISIA